MAEARRKPCTELVANQPADRESAIQVFPSPATALRASAPLRENYAGFPDRRGRWLVGSVDCYQAAINENQLGTLILAAALEIHRELGPGLFESVYHAVLASELESRGLSVRCRVPIPIVYKGQMFDEGFIADIIVNNLVLVELKSVEHVNSAHKKQVQTYLRLSGLKLGYLLNFSEETLRKGITRCVNGLETDFPGNP